jgi:hypothetical protein
MIADRPEGPEARDGDVRASGEEGAGLRLIMVGTIEEEEDDEEEEASKPAKGAREGFRA